MLDGSWPGLGASLEMPDEPGKLVSGLFRDIADLYYRDYVATHNRSAKSSQGAAPLEIPARPLRQLNHGIIPRAGI